jgi:TonB family protein
VDRVGVKLGFGFPAGVEVSRLAALCEEPIKPRSSVKGMQCSLSGLENQCNALLNEGKTPEYVCKYCLLCVGETLVRMANNALTEHPGLPVVFAGGVMSSDIIRNWVQQRVKYPAIAQENGIQGKVTISFVVNTDGSVSNIEVLRTPDRTLSDEAVRIIKSSPKWTAAKQRNKSVRQKFVIPIDFRISD